MIDDAARLRLFGATAVCALAAVALPMVPPGSLVGVQLVLALGALGALVAVANGASGLTVALVCVTLEVAVADGGSAAGTVCIVLAATFALAAAEGACLCAVWRGSGRRTWTAERRHVGGSLRRVLIGGCGAAVIGVVAAVDPPRSFVLGGVGVVAAGLATWLVLAPSGA